MNGPCWDTRIAEARDRGYFLPEDRVLARQWHSCSVGEAAQRAKINPYKLEDAMNSFQGVKFLAAVMYNEVEKAASIHAEIQGLAAKIIPKLPKDEEYWSQHPEVTTDAPSS